MEKWYQSEIKFGQEKSVLRLQDREHSPEFENNVGVYIN